MTIDLSGSRTAAQDVIPLPFADLERDVREAFDEASHRLRGSQCSDCSRKVFPAASVCFICRGVNVVEIDLPEAGTLYAYTWVTTNRDPAMHYGLGYVDLEDDVRVLTRLEGRLEDFTCGIRVRVGSGPDGAWHFAPVSLTSGRNRS